MATNPMQRKARNSFLGGMLVTLIITGAIIVLLIMHIKQKNDAEEALKKQNRVVYVLGQDVKSGQVITTDMFSTIEMNKDLIPSNAIDLSVLEQYSLEDKEGNSVFTKTDKNGNTALYIKQNGETYELKQDDTTGNYYIEKTKGEKTFINLINVPIVAKVDLNKNSILTTELISKNDDVVKDDVRKQEYNMLALPMDLATGDYIDIRLMLPSGQDYIVVSKKEVEMPVIGSTDSEDTLWVKLSEDETLHMSNAIVEAYMINGAKLYVSKYTEAGMQEAAKVTYPINAQVKKLLENDPNVLEKAKKELQNRYNAELRNNYINREIENAGEEGQENIQTKMEESITNTKENRKKYLDALSGETVE